MPSDTRLIDGSWDFSAGCDSGKVTTIASELMPNGLKRNQLAWLSNATCRGGGITQRTGWQPLCTVHSGAAVYQGGWLYDNSFQGGNPYLLLMIEGNLFQVRVDTNNAVANLTTAVPLANPPLEPQSYFAQGEEFAVIQAGDGTTLPLFWDGTTLRRSTGAGFVSGVTAANFVVPPFNEYVDITLVAPYIGAINQVVVIGGEFYLQVDRLNSCTLLNVDNAGVGNIYPAGTQVFDGVGTLIGTTLVSFITPIIGNPVALPVWITPFPTAPLNVVIDGTNWQITAAPDATVPAPAANHEYFVNLTQDPGPPAVTVVFPVNLNTIGEIPPATAMDYFMGRLWYAQDRQYTAGDIVLGPSGTQPYRKRDSILKITENPLALAGDGFVVPTQDGVIRALHHSANMDANLGEGQLFAFTRKSIYSLSVPVKRADWLTSTEPLQKVVQNKNGAYGDRCVVNANGDLFYQSSDGIRSLFVSTRNFSEWANLPISSNINRLLNFNNREFMRFSSGIYWDNRLYQTALPFQSDVGVAFKSIAVLDFDLISSLQEKQPPAWEGSLNGLSILQLFSGDFGGRDRAFAVVRSELDGSIQVWELDASTKNDNGDSRVEWFLETPSFTWGKEFFLKKLDGLQLWIDRISGTVDITVEYRPDGHTCWIYWASTRLCSARNSCEDLANPICYPQEPYSVFGEGNKFSLNFPRPPAPDCQTLNARPTDIGYQHQLRITIKGWCRVRGIMVYAIPVGKAPFEGMAC